MISRKIPAIYISFVLLFMLAVMAMLHHINELDLYDFQVYYSAARGLIEDTPLYGSPFGLPTGFYKYSPVTALFFVPVSLLPYSAAMILQYLFIMALTYAVTFKSSSMVSSHFFPDIEPIQNRLLLFAFIPIAMHVFRELSLGNVNLLLLLLALISQDLILKGRAVSAGVVLTLICLTKPYFGLLVLPLILYRQWKVIGTMAVTTALSPILLIPFAGISGTVTLFRDWFLAMMDHSSYLTSPHYIGYYLNGLGFSESGAVYLLTASLMVFTPVVYLLIKRKGKEITSQEFLLLSWLLYGMVPNLVITDTEHFLASLPIILFTLFELFKRKNWKLGVWVVLLIIGFGTNSRYLIGENGWRLYRTIGVLGLANLGFLLTAVLLYLRRFSKTDKIAAPLM